MLAVSAARAGFRPVAIDLFGDCDTCEITRCIVLPSLEEAAVLGVLESLVRVHGRVSLVYGSGIDTRPDLVEKISERVELLGNPSAVLIKVHRPGSFFSLLDSLAIPYPETLFFRPENPDGWLFKMPYTEGGLGVLSGSIAPENARGYYQKHLPGPARSLLFLANRGKAQLIGFNLQWIENRDAQAPFRFCGIMNGAGLSSRQQRQLGDYAEKLAESVPLAGLNTLDFLIEDGECKVLEVNPRPGTSMMLYDDLFPRGLLREHIDAVYGLNTSFSPPRQSGLRGMEIVYAERALKVGKDLEWPDWVTDRPQTGTTVRTNEPLCTVTASADSPDALRDRLARRRQKIQSLIFVSGANNYDGSKKK
ncbi:MAG: ATP-grasp domain-containing protein [Gammaproteobacteria bacterium]